MFSGTGLTADYSRDGRIMKPHNLCLVGLVAAVTLAAGVKPPRLFETSDHCVACHNGIVTPAGEDVSIGVAWRPTMMSHSARDPYWQAAIRRETLEHPSARAEIEHECAACHMPMSRFSALAAGTKGQVFTHLPVSHRTSPDDLLAADGVSCTMCHQITKDKLGERESFVAGFVVDTAVPLGRRKVFGPFDVDDGRRSVMRSAALFQPEKALHIQSSELCATCHTLYTQALNDQAEAVGVLPEQVPYLEWRHSSYVRGKSCQNCHMPAVDGETPITGIAGKARAGFSRHTFLGGNFFLQRLLNVHRDELGVVALPQEMDAAAGRTVTHLQEESAEVAIRDPRLEDGALRFEVAVRNLAGHKLPTAYPSRRVWLHVQVLDGAGRLVFESGRLNPDGSIAGNDNDADGTRYEPHYAEITEAGEVQIYEGILAGPDRDVTTVLLRAVRYVKDNRLLPDGFDKATAEADYAAKGGAVEDDDFIGGGDRVRYVVESVGPGSRWQVRAELIYQPISFRWARNLALRPSDEGDSFLSYYGAASTVSSVVLSRAERDFE
jgi:hypothetical protein